MLMHTYSAGAHVPTWVTAGWPTLHSVHTREVPYASVFGQQCPV